MDFLGSWEVLKIYNFCDSKCHHRRSHTWPRLHYEMSWQLFYRYLFYNGGLWGKCLVCRGFYCNTTSGCWEKIESRLSAVIGSSSNNTFIITVDLFFMSPSNILVAVNCATCSAFLYLVMLWILLWAHSATVDMCLLLEDNFSYWQQTPQKEQIEQWVTVLHWGTFIALTHGHTDNV